MKKYLTYETIMNKYEHIEKIWQNMNNYEKLKHENLKNMKIFPFLLVQDAPRCTQDTPRHFQDET